MLESRKDLKDRIAALETDLAEAESLAAQLDAARAESSTLSADLTDLREEASALAQQNQDLTAQLTEATDKLATFDVEVEKAAQAKSQAYLQTLGHPPIDLDDSADDPVEPAADKSLVEKIAEINDPVDLYHATADREAVLAALFPRHA